MSVGPREGSLLGGNVGCFDGSLLGGNVGCFDGSLDGFDVILNVGLAVVGSGVDVGTLPIAGATETVGEAVNSAGLIGNSVMHLEVVGIHRQLMSV